MPEQQVRPSFYPLLDRVGEVAVKISARSARLRFHGCEPDYIRTVCHGACCRSTTWPGGTSITILPTEAPVLEGAYGVRIADGFLQPAAGERRCPFQGLENLCSLHGGPHKPFGCVASPFILNRRGTLIVRHRYTLLRCHRKADQREPAYRAFGASLVLLFGPPEAARITAHLDVGGGDLLAWMPCASAEALLWASRTRRRVA